MIHGFNDANPYKTLGGLAFDLHNLGITSDILDYGWQATLSTRKAVKALTDEATPGCNIIAHSNGALAAVTAAIEHGLWIRNLIMVQPPIARDINLPPLIDRCAGVWNRGDKVVSMASRYNALVNALTPWNRVNHQFYGDMGRTGPVSWSRIKSVEVSATLKHSGVFLHADTRAVIVDLVKS